MLVGLVSTSCTRDYDGYYYNDDSPYTASFLGRWKTVYKYNSYYGRTESISRSDYETVTFYSDGTGDTYDYWGNRKSFDWWYSRSGGWVDIREVNSSVTIRRYWRFTTDGYFETCSTNRYFTSDYFGYQRN